jgi:hypothetical protein
LEALDWPLQNPSFPARWVMLGASSSATQQTLTCDVLCVDGQMLHYWLGLELHLVGLAQGSRVQD